VRHYSPSPVHSEFADSSPNVLRYLFGLTGTALTNGALGATATRTDPAAIKAYLETRREKPL